MCDLDIKAGGQTGGDRIEDVKIFTGQNEYITGTAQAECFGDKVREERLRWLGHVQRRGCGYTRERVLKMELPGSPHRGLMDVC